MSKRKPKSFRIPKVPERLLTQFNRECRKARLPMTDATILLMYLVVKKEIDLVKKSDISDLIEDLKEED